MARSFPCALPLFRLDRIYVRGFHVEKRRCIRAALVEDFRSCRAVGEDDSKVIARASARLALSSGMEDLGKGAPNRGCNRLQLAGHRQ